MKITKIRLLLIIILFFTCICTSCGNNKFDSNYNDFKDCYLMIVRELDYKEPWTSIEKLKTDPISNQVDDLKDIVSKMNELASSKTEKRIYDNALKYYSGIEFLQYAAQNKDYLSEDERGRIATELTLIEMRKKNVEEK